jgi:hypothetical protein
MPDLPRAGCATYLASLSTVPGLRDWVAQGRDVELRDFTEIGALQNGAWRDIAARAKADLAGHAGRIGLHGPFWGFQIDQPDPDLRAIVQDRMLCALDALDLILGAKGGGHMVVHFPLHHLVRLQPRHRDGRSGGHHGPHAGNHGPRGCAGRDSRHYPRGRKLRRPRSAGTGGSCPRLCLARGRRLAGHRPRALCPRLHRRTARRYPCARRRAASRPCSPAGCRWRGRQALGASGRATIRWHGLFRALAELPQMPRLIIEMARPEDILVSARYLEAERLAV